MVSNSMKFDVEGMDLIKKRILELGLKGARAENKAVREGGNIVAEHMRENVARSDKDHPHMKDNIVVSRVKGDIPGEKKVDVGPDKKVGWRAGFLEFGTEHAPAYPFIEPSAEQSRTEVKEKIKEVLKEGLDL